MARDRDQAKESGKEDCGHQERKVGEVHTPIEVTRRRVKVAREGRRTTSKYAATVVSGDECLAIEESDTAAIGEKVGIEGGTHRATDGKSSQPVRDSVRMWKDGSRRSKGGGIKRSHQGNQTKSQGYPVRGGVREEGDIALDTVDTKEIGRWGGRTWEKGYDLWVTCGAVEMRVSKFGRLKKKHVTYT
ncbi:hypothetical protein H4582DRAFT_2063843 [Lactarius indigo]|nr:hypothetical protein H4582DRAFT_2063843 [Lactarius indigo]